MEQGASTRPLRRLASGPCRLLAVLGAALAVSGCAVSGPAAAQHSAGQAPFADCPGCPELVVIPPGSFLMGENGGEPGRYEGPVRTIRVARAFALARHEVTHGQFRTFVESTGYQAAPGCHVRSPEGGDPFDPERGWEDPGYGRPPLDMEPVACVSWNDAMAYIEWLSDISGRQYRLPSETEWEYAARGGTSGRFTWGERADLACLEANIFDRSAFQERPVFLGAVAPCDDGYPGPAPVGRFAPNAFGLHDMIGNVWEWVADCYEMPHAATAPTDGSPQLERGCDRRGARGGSWGSTFDRQRPAFRGRDPATLQSQVFGFRVARDLDQ